jgi:hypothetical protein
VGAGHPQALRPAHQPGEAAVVARARQAGLQIDAWTVTLHRDDLARQEPAAHLSFIDAFGERLGSWVCPSSQEAAAYLLAHVSDLHAAGHYGRIVVEGCHYPLLQHGGAHERDLSHLDDAARRLLELCFCDACMERLAGAGHDAEGWRAAVAGALIADPGRLAGDPRLAAVVALRRRRVVELLARMREAAPAHDLFWADQPAIAGHTFRTGTRSPLGTEEVRATVGLDLAALAAAGIKIMCLAYFRSTADVAAHVASYIQAGVAPSMLAVALRPGPPDSSDLESLAEKLDVVRRHGVEDVAFYELSQMDGEGWGRTLAAIPLAAAA